MIRFSDVKIRKTCVVLLLVSLLGAVWHCRSGEHLTTAAVILEWEEDGPVTVFWREDGECSHHQTRFLARHSLPTRALVSYPGSGNTWTRY